MTVFPEKLWDILERGYSSIGWLDDDHIHLKDFCDFEAAVMPQYFSATSIHSFTRQLSYYGFDMELKHPLANSNNKAATSRVFVHRSRQWRRSAGRQSCIGIKRIASKAGVDRKKRAKTEHDNDGGGGGGGGGGGAAAAKAGVGGDAMPLCPWTAQGLATVDRLLVEDGGRLFHRAVDMQALGIQDYHSVIAVPMDLGLVRRKLNHGLYDEPRFGGGGLAGFADDLNRIWGNALRYNGRHSPVSVEALRLARVASEMLPTAATATTAAAASPAVASNDADADVDADADAAARGARTPHRGMPPAPMTPLAMLPTPMAARCSISPGVRRPVVEPIGPIELSRRMQRQEQQQIDVNELLVDPRSHSNPVSAGLVEQVGPCAYSADDAGAPLLPHPKDMPGLFDELDCIR
jgi:hypothetical protein